jgi:hypothetical protein
MFGKVHPVDITDSKRSWIISQGETVMYLHFQVKQYDWRNFLI